MPKDSCRWLHRIFLVSLPLATPSARAATFFPRPLVSFTSGLFDLVQKRNVAPIVTTSSSTSTSSAAVAMAVGLRGGEVSEIATAAYEWCTNLGNPSALVAGAVIATIYENIGSGALEIEKDDHPHVKFSKRLTRMLLLSAFAFEVISIFVTTVTGTMLMSQSETALNAMVQITEETTPLSFLHDNFEFEYLTARITFLQGLLNWIMAIALGHLIPGDESTETRLVNKFIGKSLFLTMVFMLAFYNKHMNFYSNYFVMFSRWIHVIIDRFILQWPPRPSMLFLIPSLVMTLSSGYDVFRSNDKKKKQMPDRNKT